MLVAATPTLLRTWPIGAGVAPILLCRDLVVDQLLANETMRTAWVPVPPAFTRGFLLINNKVPLGPTAGVEVTVEGSMDGSSVSVGPANTLTAQPVMHIPIPDPWLRLVRLAITSLATPAVATFTAWLVPKHN